MAPQRLRGPPEDLKSDTFIAKEKHSTSSVLPATIKSRRNASSNVHNGSHLKDVTTLTTASEDTAGQQAGSEAPLGMDWANLDPSILNAYRHAYRLNTPSAFTSSYNQILLTGPLGRSSPTMAKAKDRRRVSKENLAMAVRKDFKAAGISEQEVFASFMYAVHNQGKNFRMRFTPSK